MFNSCLTVTDEAETQKVFLSRYAILGADGNNIYHQPAAACCLPRSGFPQQEALETGVVLVCFGVVAFPAAC